MLATLVPPCVTELWSNYQSVQGGSGACSMKVDVWNEHVLIGIIIRYSRWFARFSSAVLLLFRHVVGPSCRESSEAKTRAWKRAKNGHVGRDVSGIGRSSARVSSLRFCSERHAFVLEQLRVIVRSYYYSYYRDTEFYDPIVAAAAWQKLPRWKSALLLPASSPSFRVSLLLLQRGLLLAIIASGMGKCWDLGIYRIEILPLSASIV